MSKRLKQATPELVAAMYALIGAALPSDPVETVTVTFTEDQCIKLIETRYVTEEIVPFVPKVPE